MRIAGLTGNIGAGKSTVAELLRSKGIPVEDLDRIGNEVLDGESLRAELQKLSPDFVINDGVDRKRIREKIFSDPSLKTRLEGLLHTKIWEEFARRKDAHQRAGHSLIVCEAALLVESKKKMAFDELIVVYANPKVRETRTIHRDQISDALFRRIDASQLPQEQKLGVATIAIANDGDLESLRKKVDELIEIWRARGFLKDT